MIRLASRRAPRLFVLSLLASLPAACSFPAPSLLPPERAAPQNVYLLRPQENPHGASGAGAEASGARCAAPAGTLLVNLPRARPGFDTSGMIYLLQPKAVGIYADSRWADTPARMLAPLAALALEETGCFRAVVQMPTTVAGDIRLDLDDLALEQEFFTRPSRVRLSLAAVFVTLRDQEVVAARRFEVVEEAPSDDASGGAVAANRAVGLLLDRLAAWAASLAGGEPGRGGAAETVQPPRE